MKKAFGIFVIVFLFFAVGSYWYYISIPKHKLKSSSQAIVVSVAPVQKMNMPKQINSVGTLQANQSVNMSPQVAGQIAAILFREGSHVKKGTPLIKLDSTILQASLKSSQASLKLAKVEYIRAKKLAKRGALSQQDLDKAKATLQQMQATVAIDKAKLAKMTLVAPFDGMLGKRQVSIGDYVNVGEGLLQIVDIANLRLSYNVPEKYISQLQLGQEVKLSTDAMPKQHFTGKVIFIAPSVDTSSHSVELHALVPNSALKLRPGMFIKVKQTLGIDKNTLVIPEQSLVSSIEGQTVYRVVNHRVIVTPVKVGTYLTGKVQILKGLTTKDLIIIAGQQKVKDGSIVSYNTKKVKSN